MESCGTKSKYGMPAIKYTFSGHESFTCKTLWLKKGYDFILNGFDFNSPDAVIRLGVGKNMVSSIRFWMRAFGMTQNDKLQPISSYLLDTENGKDPFLEDLGTLWLLHFMLISCKEATLYNWLFTRLQRERKVFERQNFVSFVHRLLVEEEKQNFFNENTIKKDIGTLLQNYVMPQKAKTFDDYSALLLDLYLIRTEDGKTYTFNIEGKRQVPWQIFLYAVIKMKEKDNTVSYDILQEIGLIFCMNDIEVIEMCKVIESHHIKDLRYSDTAGIRQLQFINPLTCEETLDEYYG